METNQNQIYIQPATVPTAVTPSPPVVGKKNYYFLLLPMLILIVLAASVFLPPSKPKITRTDLQFQYGKDTVKEVEYKQGKSISQITRENGWQLEEYKNTTGQYTSYATYDENGKIQSYFYPANNQATVDSYLEKYDQPENIYSSNFSPSVKVVVWPKFGLAVWFEQDSGQIVFIRDFKPVDLKDFVRLYGEGLK